MDQTDLDRFEDLMEGNTSDPKVQYELGLCYLYGRGVEQNGQKADFWLRRAADQGLEEAIALLDSNKPQMRSEEVTTDTLMDWCVAAEEGDPEAQYRVAEYFRENPTPGAEADVERYLSRAVAQGHPKACYELALRRLGEGRAQEGIQLLRNALDCGLPEAAEQMGFCYARGIGVAADPAEAEHYFGLAAQMGGAEAMLALAARYATGDGLARSMGKALSWLRQAEAAGMADAKERFDDLYAETRIWDGEKAERAFSRYRHYTPSSCPIAVRYGPDAVPDREKCRQAAEAGDPEAAGMLGCYYEKGEGGRKKAAALYLQAHEGGSVIGTFSLGLCYEYGIGVPMDKAKAVRLYRQAAEAGYVLAQCNLGYCYEEGVGVDADKNQAVEWYRKAAEQGSLTARHNLIGTGVTDELQIDCWYVCRPDGDDADGACCYQYAERPAGVAGQDFIARGDDLPEVKGTPITLYGRWGTDTDSSGEARRVFHVSSFALGLPRSAEGVVAYMKFLGCGIGEQRAKAIYEKFGEDIWYVCLNYPERLREVPRLSDHNIHQIFHRLRANLVRMEVSRLFGQSNSHDTK